MRVVLRARKVGGPLICRQGAATFQTRCVPGSRLPTRACPRDRRHKSFARRSCRSRCGRDLSASGEKRERCNGSTENPCSTGGHHFPRRVSRSRPPGVTEYLNTLPANRRGARNAVDSSHSGEAAGGVVANLVVRARPPFPGHYRDTRRCHCVANYSGVFSPETTKPRASRAFVRSG